VRKTNLLGAAAVETVKKNLQRLDSEFCRLARLDLAAFLQNGQTDVPDFAFAILLREQRPRFLILENRIRTGMKLVKVNRLDAQRFERGFEFDAHACDGKIVGAVNETFEVMAKFRAIIQREWWLRDK
jgi:hypothetical protein